MIITRKNQDIEKKVYLVLIIGLIIRTIIAIYLYPGYDEAYYYLYTKYLDWSYFDHPPLVALTTGLGIWLTGAVNQFTIRIGTLILHTGSLYLLYLTGKKLFDAQVGLFTVIIASLIPIFQIAFGVLTLPDVPLIFFWTLTLYLIAEEFFANSGTYQPTYRVAVIGLVVGLACLSKYHGFILGLGLVSFCLSNPKYWQVFYSRWLWLGFLLFLLTMLPLLYWNWQNDWISFTFQLSGRFESSQGLQINLLNLILFFLVGNLYLFPSLGFPLWWVTGKALFLELVTRPNYRIQLILWVSLPIVLGFTLLGATTQILPTWPMPGFWGLILILGYCVNVWWRRSPQVVKKWLNFSGLAIQTLFIIALLHISTGLLQNPNQYPLPTGFISPDDDPSTELIDVVQLGSEFNLSTQFREVFADSDFVFTNAYYLGGYIGMALAQNPDMIDMPITCFSDDVRGFKFWSSMDNLLGKDALYITTSNFGQNEELTADLSGYFDTFSKVTEIPITRAGEVTELFYVYQGLNLLAMPDFIN